MFIATSRRLRVLNALLILGTWKKQNIPMPAGLCRKGRDIDKPVLQS